MTQQHTAALPARAAAYPPDPVRVWLLAVALLVLAMVSVGGATRLTGSGLSITEWQPIMGVIPPLSDAAWQETFEKYRQIPQYKLINKGMSLDAFKAIYWWEWTHRFLGRLLGVVFLVPFVYFLVTGRITRALVPKLAGIFALGGLQGAIGWYMVRSGLAERISVSQYRLALHLGLAAVIFAALLWVALSMGRSQAVSQDVSPARRRVAAALVGLVFLQIVAGAFVAGLKAGAGYNTWPLMDGQLIPDGLGVMSPWWSNLFENATTVQFNHRLLAYAVTGAVLWHVLSFLPRANGPQVRASAITLLLAVLAQVAVGIWTLLAHVPLSLGLAHQAGAMIVLAAALWHLHTVRAAV
jgi:cytochrome c oxidase assembly protein subunit 15